ncbi:hypothetical protein VP01_415g2 [Puccinia sorghi]|uniref:Uncharacterized protein n=1 Tax=Puccinia sorghi TaxID=27349 RepID=A0A0L6UQZ5_9BASI|nr:hypothetical protein VP01_415g2 [Puccinia sorghi]
MTLNWPFWASRCLTLASTGITTLATCDLIWSFIIHYIYSISIILVVVTDRRESLKHSKRSHEFMALIANDKMTDKQISCTSQQEGVYLLDRHRLACCGSIRTSPICIGCEGCLLRGIKWKKKSMMNLPMRIRGCMSGLEGTMKTHVEDVRQLSDMSRMPSCSGKSCSSYSPNIQVMNFGSGNKPSVIEQIPPSRIRGFLGHEVLDVKQLKSHRQEKLPQDLCAYAETQFCRLLPKYHLHLIRFTWQGCQRLTFCGSTRGAVLGTSWGEKAHLKNRYREDFYHLNCRGSTAISRLYSLVDLVVTAASTVGGSVLTCSGNAYETPQLLSGRWAGLYIKSWLPRVGI